MLNSGKFWSHLELYGQDIVTDSEDDEQGLLGADGNNLTENDLKDKKDGADSDESEVSYYTVDLESGEVQRKMIKKSKLQIELDKKDKKKDLENQVEMIEKFDMIDGDN